MGRELRRVPLDFEWPLNMTWKGYLNPYHSQECTACKRSGLNAATKKLDDDFYDFDNTGGRWCDKITQDEVEALQNQDRLRVWTVVNGEGQWTRKDGLTAAEVNAANERFGDSSIDRWALKHDAINRWILVETRAKRLGVYGNCECCGGEGEVWFSDEIKRLHEAWEKVEPPTGDGFQLWETTSEGSPQSPVFATFDALCAWCEKNATTFGSNKTTAAHWRAMLESDCVCHSEPGVGVFL